MPFKRVYVPDPNYFIALTERTEISIIAYSLRDALRKRIKSARAYEKEYAQYPDSEHSQTLKSLARFDWSEARDIGRLFRRFYDLVIRAAMHQKRGIE